MEGLFEKKTGTGDECLTYDIVLRCFFVTSSPPSKARLLRFRCVKKYGSMAKDFKSGTTVTPDVIP